jgi:hypothetical protein
LSANPRGWCSLRFKRRLEFLREFCLKLTQGDFQLDLIKKVYLIDCLLAADTKARVLRQLKIRFDLLDMPLLGIDEMLVLFGRFVLLLQ